jgi:IS5 family transposase
LIIIAEDTLKAAKRTLQGAKISFTKGKRSLKKKFIEQLDQTYGLLQKAIKQAKTVVSGNRHIEDRLVSIYEPEARPIRKGKSGKSVQFGRKLLLTGNEQGFITSHKLYQGNPNDKTLFKDGLEGHNRNVGKKAKEAATDRGFYSPQNDTDGNNEEMRTSMPKIGKKSASRIAYERQSWFKRLQRFRAGMEAIISIANRRSGLCKPLTRGTAKVQCSVGWSIFAYNLAIVPRVKTR